MFTFSLKHDGRKRRMALVSLHPATPQVKGDNTHYYVSCGAYAPDNGSGRMEYQGVSIRGDVPIQELVRWALRKGFLAWEVQPDWGGNQK
jgi:hypothetical protein